MSKSAGLDFNFDGFFDDLVTDLQTKFATDTAVTNIVDFIEQEIHPDWGIELDVRQMLILKIFYGHYVFNDEERAIIQTWYELDRTTFDLCFSLEMEIGKKQALILECGRRGGKCHSLYTLLGSQKYGMIYGHELFKEAMSVSQNLNMLTLEQGMQQLKDVALPLSHTVATEGTNKRATAENFYVKGQTKTKKVLTECSYNLEATPEHRIKVLNTHGNIEWRYFRDIQVGEWACIHRATDLFPTEYVSIKHLAPSLTKYSNGMSVKQRQYPEFLGADLGRLLGLLVGDGSWTSNCQIQLTTHLQDIPWYTDVVTKTGLEYPKETKDKRSQFGARLSIGCKVLRSYFDSLGFVIESHVTTKKVPWSIRRSPKDVQAAFLSGLFAADGSCEKGGREVTLSTASKQLAEEVQLMLLNFGVVSRVRTKDVKGTDYYVLILRGQRSVKKFAVEIGFGLPRKQQLLVDYLAASGRDGGDTERIPNQKVWLKRLRDSLPSNRGKQPGSAHAAGKLLGSGYADRPKTPNLKLEFRAIVGNSIKENSTEEFSAYRLPALIEFAEEHCSDLEAVEHFKYLRDCDYFYDLVESVEDSEAFCVDLSVPGCEQYVAQGFTNHNTMVGSLIVAYEFYKLCLQSSPQLHYGIAASTPIAIFCMATAAEQTKRTIYGQARALLYYVPVIRRLIDQKRIIVGEQEIKYPEKLLYIYAGNSKSSSQVGSSVILLVMDEVARFKSDNGESNALELWSNIGVSGVTFGPDALRVAISSAWEDEDAIQKLYRTCKDPEVADSMVGFRLRSWDLNPKRAGRQQPVIKIEYAEDPIKAALEFEGIRHSGQYSFLDKEEVVRAFRGSSKIKVVKDTSGGDGLVRMQATVAEADGIVTYLHLDPAVKRDAYGLAFGHKERDSQGETLVVIDGLVAWEPEPGIQVSITNVQSVIYEINRKRPLAKVTSDHAHSPETIQRLKANGLRAETIFFSRGIQLDMYDCLRKLLHENRIIFPKMSEFTSLLKDELIHLQLINANKIDHKPDKCLVGETRIPLLDGTTPMISELVGKEVWVYSAKSDGTLVPGRARGRKTMEVTELLDVGLDNGSVIRCTPDHPFMLRNGEYIQAKNIIPYVTRLMPITISGPVLGGYRKASGIRGRYLVHHIALNYPDLSGNKVVHHKNGIRHDNRPENLEVMAKSDHSREHTTERHQQDAQYRNKLSEGTKKFNQLESTRIKRSKQMKARSTDWYKAKVRSYKTFRSDMTIKKLLEALSVGCKNCYQACTYLKCGRNVVVRLLKDNAFDDWEAFKAAYANYVETASALYTLNNNRTKIDVNLVEVWQSTQKGSKTLIAAASQAGVSVDTIRKNLKEHGYVSWADFLIKGAGENHKARFVTPVILTDPVPVYDLEVDEWDNFAVSAGIIVHNSKDLADCVAAICWQLVGNTHADWSSSRKLAVPKPAAIFSPTVEDDFSSTRGNFKREVLGTRQRWGSFSGSGGGSRFSLDSW